MDIIRTVIDYFQYSEGNIKALLICCLISLSCIVLMLLTRLFEGKPGNRGAAAGTMEAAVSGNSEGGRFCKKCGKLLKNGAVFCEYCGTKQ